MEYNPSLQGAIASIAFSLDILPTDAPGGADSSMIFFNVQDSGGGSSAGFTTISPAPGWQTITVTGLTNANYSGRDFAGALDLDFGFGFESFGDVTDGDESISVGVDNFRVDVTVVPEPGTALLVGLGAMRARGESQERRDPSARARLGHEDRDRLVGEARHVEVLPLREHCGGYAQAVHETLVVRLGLREAERAGAVLLELDEGERARSRLAREDGDRVVAAAGRIDLLSVETESDRVRAREPVDDSLAVAVHRRERERSRLRIAREVRDRVVVRRSDVDVRPSPLMATSRAPSSPSLAPIES